MVNEPARKTVSLLDTVALTIGVVIGAGIFRTPSVVAASSGGETTALLIWLFGGMVSFLGALCYAELGSSYPHTGGEYHYVFRAFGGSPAFLFAWSRMTVIQTGSIATLAFLIGDYATQMFRMGEYSSAWYAGMLIIMVTAVNIAGVRQGMWIQKILTTVIIVGLLSVAGTGLILAAPSGPSGTALMCGRPGGSPLSGIGRAMIFVLFTYGGWNEVAYLSAEVHDTRRTIVRALMVSIGVVTAIYLIFNIALIKGLGLAAAAGSDAVAADLMRRMFGAGGARFISLLIIIAAASTMNGVVITGARTNYALGRDFALFSFMGRWREKGSTPVNALLLQGAIALALVTVGALSHNGFVMMVEYTAPVFWLFFFLAGVSLMALRRSEPGTERPFRVPLYPAIPLLFCGFCLYMLHASLAYTGVGAVMGVVVLLAGALLLWVKKTVFK